MLAARAGGGIVIQSVRSVLFRQTIELVSDGVSESAVETPTRWTFIFDVGGCNGLHRL